MPETHEGILQSSVRAPRTASGMNSPLWGWGKGLAPFFSPVHQRVPSSVGITVPIVGASAAHINPKPLQSAGASLLGKVSLRQRTVVLSPRRPEQTPPHTEYTDHRVLQNFSFRGNRVWPLLTSRPKHTFLKLATLWPRPIHSPLQARRTSEEDWTEGKCSQNTIAECTYHTPETLSKMSDPG